MFRRTFLGTFAAVSLAGVTASFADGHGLKDIVDTAAGTEGFSTLVAAVTAADLVDVLKGEGPFTVFAPTDEAFAALPEGTVETLLKPENKDQLVAVLTYHVLSGKVMSADIAGKELSVATVNGEEVDVNATDGVMVDNATVVAADIEASNGVIHVIDTVILPGS
ncbi:MAG: fasciclin domain-containing protein [Pseudomonadota bacterium]